MHVPYLVIGILPTLSAAFTCASFARAWVL